MKTLSILLLIFTAGWGYAQEKEEAWYPGQVKFNSGNTFTGLFAYDLGYDVVKFKVQQRLQVYPAIQVEAFSFADTAYNIYRKYYSLPFSIQSDYKRMMFFESIVEGKLSLFAREKKVRADEMLPETIMIPHFPQWKTAYDFYAADSLGNLHALTEDTEEVLLHLMQDQMGSMMKYIRTKKPDFSSRSDMLGLFMYYNVLTDTSRFQDTSIKVAGFDNTIPIW
ncbi:hypothetical protein WJR50_28480 [Catalinimonas sp. 4WD22]|uniref:hypothetical protein n=1 Tax=Catalinimonas locisalis TaxID=3133978 RepID=UPI00310123F2